MNTVEPTYSPHQVVSDVLLWLREQRIPASVLDATAATRAAESLLRALGIEPEVTR